MRKSVRLKKIHRETRCYDLPLCPFYLITLRGSNHPPINDTPTSISLDYPTDGMLSASFRVSITLADIGDDNPDVGDAATAAISQTCSYKK